MNTIERCFAWFAVWLFAGVPIGVAVGKAIHRAHQAEADSYSHRES